MFLNPIENCLLQIPQVIFKYFSYILQTIIFKNGSCWLLLCPFFPFFFFVNFNTLKSFKIVIFNKKYQMQVFRDYF